MKTTKTKVTDGSTTLGRSKALTQRRKTSESEYANVNSYKHFLSIPSANHPYIRWAVGLRAYDPPKVLKNSSSVPPETYYKTIQSRKMKHTTADIDQNVNISEVEHLALHRPGVHASSGQLMFETTLRKTEKSKQLLGRQKGWCSIPKKDRHEDPQFIKTKSLRKKNMQPQQFQSGVDGSHHYPKFTEKIIRNRNVNNFRHMIKGKINLPSIGWQTNLRSY